MDRYLTFEGEQPVWLDDFDFMQKSVRDTISRMISAVSTNKVVILQGCEFGHEGLWTTWTDGIIAIDGEILPIRAGKSQTLPLYYNIQTELSGNRIFKNGAEHKCYESRYATLSRATNDYGLGDEIRFDDALSRITKEVIYEIPEPENGFSHGSIIRSAAGGYYIKGHFSVPITGVKTDTVIPDTAIADLKLDDVKSFIGAETYSTMTFKKVSGGAEIYPMIIVLKQGDLDEVIVSVKFAQETSVSFGSGNFYCRIID